MSKREQSELGIINTSNPKMESSHVGEFPFIWMNISFTKIPHDLVIFRLLNKDVGSLDETLTMLKFNNFLATQFYANSILAIFEEQDLPF